MWVVEVINTIDSNHLNVDGIHARDYRSDLGDLHRAVPARELRAPDREHDPVRVHGRDHRAAGRGAAGACDGDRDRDRRPRDVADRAGRLGHGRRERRRVRLRRLPAHARAVRPQRARDPDRRVSSARSGAARCSRASCPHYGVSWQGHLCGAIAGVHRRVAARVPISGRRRRTRPPPRRRPRARDSSRRRCPGSLRD